MLLVLLARGFQRLGCINPHLAIKIQKEALTVTQQKSAGRAPEGPLMDKRRQELNLQITDLDDLDDSKVQGCVTNSASSE